MYQTFENIYGLENNINFSRLSGNSTYRMLRAKQGLNSYEKIIEIDDEKVISIEKLEENEAFKVKTLNVYL